MATDTGNQKGIAMRPQLEHDYSRSKRAHMMAVSHCTEGTEKKVQDEYVIIIICISYINMFNHHLGNK